MIVVRKPTVGFRHFVSVGKIHKGELSERKLAIIPVTTIIFFMLRNIVA